MPPIHYTTKCFQNNLRQVTREVAEANLIGIRPYNGGLKPSSP